MHQETTSKRRSARFKSGNVLISLSFSFYFSLLILQCLLCLVNLCKNRLKQDWVSYPSSSAFVSPVLQWLTGSNAFIEITAPLQHNTNNALSLPETHHQNWNVKPPWVSDFTVMVFTMQAWLSRYSITSTSCRLRAAPACSCLRVIFRDVGDILDRV